MLISLLFYIPLILFVNFGLLDLLVFFLFMVLFSFYHNFYCIGFMDGLSVSLSVLTVYFGVVMNSLALKYFKTSYLTFKHLSVWLIVLVLICFFFKSVWGFYVSFEFSLIPLLLMIYNFGYQVERLQASFYLFFYTMFGSLPFLVILNNLFNNIDFSSLSSFNSMSLMSSGFYVLLISLIFFIKLPIYLFHLWLPKAHVEAPVAGSMVLAALMLKLGGYGLFRFLQLSEGSNWLTGWFISSVLWGAVLSSLICLIQSDLKALVAYSSITHMGVLMGGFFLFSIMTFKGFLIMLIGHAFCSSALFFLVNLYYERSLTRQIILTRANFVGFYYFAFFLFLFLAVNFSAPPSFNLLGEIIFFMSFLGFSYMNWVLLGCISFLVGFYCIYMYSNLSHGKIWKIKSYNAFFPFLWVIMFYHVYPVFYLLVFVAEL